MPFLLAVSVLATEEVLSMFAAKNYRPVAWPVYLGNVLVPLAACLPLIFVLAGQRFPEANPLGRAGWPMAALVISAIAVIGAEMGRYRQPGTAILHAALGI